MVHTLLHDVDTFLDDANAVNTLVIPFQGDAGAINTILGGANTVYTMFTPYYTMFTPYWVVPTPVTLLTTFMGGANTAYTLYKPVRVKPTIQHAVLTILGFRRRSHAAYTFNG